MIEHRNRHIVCAASARATWAPCVWKIWLRGKKHSIGRLDFPVIEDSISARVIVGACRSERSQKCKKFRRKNRWATKVCVCKCCQRFIEKTVHIYPNRYLAWFELFVAWPHRSNWLDLTTSDILFKFTLIYFLQLQKINLVQFAYCYAKIDLSQNCYKCKHMSFHNKRHHLIRRYLLMLYVILPKPICYIAHFLSWVCLCC